MSGNWAEVASETDSKWLAGKLLDKHLAVCNDIGPECRWPKTLFLALVGDRVVSVERKYEPLDSMETNAHLMLLTNSGVPWADVAGEVKRRVVVFHFGTPVAAPSPELETLLDNELGNIFAKAVHAYHSLVDTVGIRDVWAVLNGIGNGYFEQAQRNAIN